MLHCLFDSGKDGSEWRKLLARYLSSISPCYRVVFVGGESFESSKRKRSERVKKERKIVKGEGKIR